MNRKVDKAYTAHRQTLVDPIKHYLKQQSSKKNIKDHSLLLDGTGPRLTLHLPYLKGIEAEIGKPFKRVYAFSGGIGAYCVYLAQANNFLNYEVQDYFASVDYQARLAHKISFKDYAKLLKNIFTKKPIYNSLRYMQLFRYIIKDEFFNLPLKQIAPNFIPYIALPERIRPVAVSKQNGFDRSTLTIGQVMEMGMKIPRLYSKSELALNAFDSTYTPGYWNTRQQLSKSEKSIVILTTNENKLSDTACIINILQGKNVRYQTSFDIISLLLNIPNPHYQKDLLLAYS